MASPTECAPPTPVDAPSPCPCGSEGDPFFVEAQLVVGDIEIGAVEIKNFDTDDRVAVNAGHEMSVTDATTHTTLTSIDGHVDGLEALVTTGNASLASIDAGTPAALGQALMAASQPVVIASDQSAVPTAQVATSGAATATSDVTVDATAGGISVLGANAARKSAIIQNVGTANMRVTIDNSAPTSTHGLQLVPGQSLQLRMPYIELLAVKAIREGAVNTAASVTESV